MKINDLFWAASQFLENDAKGSRVSLQSLYRDRIGYCLDRTETAKLCRQASELDLGELPEPEETTEQKLDKALKRIEELEQEIRVSRSVSVPGSSVLMYDPATKQLWVK